MALLSRKVDYALLILSFLHHRPGGGCAREIAERFGLKKAFTANVLKLLCRRGLVSSQRGINGGYSLVRPASEIVLDELLDLLGEPFRLADCNGEIECGMRETCPVRSSISEVDARIRRLLHDVTLEDLCRAPADEPCIRMVQVVGLIEHTGAE